jgi:hypothetical protein
VATIGHCRHGHRNLATCNGEGAQLNAGDEAETLERFQSGRQHPLKIKATHDTPPAAQGEDGEKENF